MAKNIIFDQADQLSLPVRAGTKSGDPVRVGGLNGVALTDRASASATPDPVRGPAVNLNPDGHASVKLNGAAEFTVDFAVANVGDPVYITADGALSGAATDNSLFGHALTTKTAPSGPLTVRIAN
ncbi:DUF2190 family protein [Desertihabitans brevis]|nr:DUF2190 family protein [Desertihabitans brevis]